MRTLTKSTSVALFAGLALTGALAACSPTTVDEAETETETTETDTTETDTGSSGGGSFADGVYTASGDYQAPSGTESVEVNLSLMGGVITAVEVIGDATDPQAKIHQGEFISGIGPIVVGKDIDSIQVDKVGGSSLTSGGFNKAIEAIKADASS